MESNEIKSVSLKKAFTEGVVNIITKVRTNTNGYPFVTLMLGGKASNVYFGKKSGAQVVEGAMLTPEQLQSAQILLTTNETGEPRLKIGLGGAEGYTNLESVFGTIDSSADEKAVLRALAVSLTAKEATVDAPAITA